MGGTGSTATPTGEDDCDAGPVQAWLTQLVKTTQGIKQSASPGGSCRPARKWPVPPKPSLTPSAKKKLRFTPKVRTDELAKQLPISEESALTLGYPDLSCQTSNQKESSSCCQRERKKSSQKSLEVEIVENTVMGRAQRRRAAPDPGNDDNDVRNAGGKLFDVQKLLTKTGMEFHWPGYQYMGPGTHLENRLARDDPGINQLDRIVKAHDIDYGKAKDLKDKWAADRKMIAKIDKLPDRKTLTERSVKNMVARGQPWRSVALVIRPWILKYYCFFCFAFALYSIFKVAYWILQATYLFFQGHMLRYL